MNRHLSPEGISQWIAGERSPEDERHVRDCPQCGAEVARLSQALLLFRDSGRRWSEHWYGAAVPVPRPAPRWRKPALAAAVAALVLLAALAIRRTAPVEGPVNAPFMEIPYVAPLAPYERSQVMRMDLPVAALIAAGFDVHVADTGGAVRADVLVGQDGRAHAIRLVPGSAN